MNIDKRRKFECIHGECHQDKSRCIVFYGNDCIRLGGRKIPIQTATVSESFPLSVEKKGFKTYFISWQVVDMEEDL